MVRLFTMLSLGDCLDLILFSYIHKLYFFSLLFLGCPLWLLLLCQMKGWTEWASEFNQTFSHLHLFVILHRQILRNFNDVLLVKGELCFIFYIYRLLFKVVHALKVLMLQDAKYKVFYSEAEGLLREEKENIDSKRSTASGDALGIRSDSYFFFISGKL